LCWFRHVEKNTFDWHGILQNFAHSFPTPLMKTQAIINSMDKVISLYQKHHLFMLHKLIKNCLKVVNTMIVMLDYME
jgi:hypothetical protein